MSQNPKCKSTLSMTSNNLKNLLIKSFYNDDTVFKEQSEVSSLSETNDEQDYCGNRQVPLLSQSKQQKSKTLPEERVLNISNPVLKKFDIRQHESKNHIFISAEQQYSRQIYKKLMSSKSNSSYYNSCIKNFEHNQRVRRETIQIFKSIVNKSEQNQLVLKNLIQKLHQKQISIEHRQPMRIEFYKCQCQNIYFDKLCLYNHLKARSHKISIKIDTEKEKKYQSKLYNTFGCIIKPKEFDAQMVYRSFQTTFLKTQLHWINFDPKISKIITKKHVMNEKLLKKQGLDSNIRQVREYFNCIWLKIYNNLHIFHKNNEQICHKCMTFEEHIALLILILDIFYRKIKKLTQQESNTLKYHCFIFLEAGRDILLQCSQRKSRQKKNETKIDALQRAKKIIMKIFIGFVNKLDYLNIQDFISQFDA